MPDWKSLIRARVAPLSELDAAREADIVDELAQHVAEHYAELVAAGVAETEAVNRALAPLDRIPPASRARLPAPIDRAAPRRCRPPDDRAFSSTSAATCAMPPVCCGGLRASPLSRW